MFILAALIGIYSYIIFSLGIFGLLYKTIVISLSIIFFAISCWFYRKSLANYVLYVNKNKLKKIFGKEKLLVVFCFLFILQVLINFIGVLGPELGFDALWYHLTLPKLYLATHSISFVSGGLLYYSAMPKLAEMLYVGGLSLGSETVVKLIHYSFGLLVCLALYKLQRKFFTPLISVIGIIIFYSNLVVGWESTSAYIDLVRTFFEILSLWAFINWWESQKKSWLIWSALMIGFAITTKLLAIGSLIIFSLLIVYYYLPGIKKVLFIRLLLYWFIALLVPLPWLIFSYVHTNNPIYPIFSPYLMHLNEKIFTVQLLSPLQFVETFWKTFIQASDPVSPLYLIFLPLIIAYLFKASAVYRLVSLYLFFGFLFWYITSQVEGTRLLVPYLPAFSFLCAGCIQYYRNKKVKYAELLKISLALVVFVALISLGYRFVANAKYLPVITGQQTKDEFLSTHLNFAYGDFYDTDGYFQKNVKPTDKVLLIGFHNLYYVDFPYVDSSWLKSGDTFNYIAVQNGILPQKFTDWELIYENEKTMVKLYKEPERMYSLK